MMIIHLSIHRPKPDREVDLVTSMHHLAAVGAGLPGFIEARTLRDTHSGRLVGMARWEDEASWRAGVEDMRAAGIEDPFDKWREGEIEGFFLEEV
jgi:heme-degrading monooxygenase HmoA